MALGTIRHLLVTSCAVSEGTVNLLALFQMVEFFANMLRYTLFDVEEVERNFSTSFPATRLSVLAAYL